MPQDGVPIRRDGTVAGLFRGDIIIRPQHALDVPQVMPALGVDHVLQVGRALGGVRQRHGPRSVGCQRRGVGPVGVDGATFEKRSNRFLEGARELLRISAGHGLPDPLLGLLMNSGQALHHRGPLVGVSGAVPGKPAKAAHHLVRAASDRAVPALGNPGAPGGGRRPWHMP